MIYLDKTVPVQRINDPLLKDYEIKLFVKREDLLHEHISGNKWRKLKYNIIQAREQGQNKLLTFGGAYSNHIAATAAAGKEFKFETIGIIRGEKYFPLNPTLQFAEDCGMQLFYVDRKKYRQKAEESFIAELHDLFGQFFLIPEGGANCNGVKGCSEILNEKTPGFDWVCCSCGTGTTLAGLILSLEKSQKALGFSSLKGGEFLKDEVSKMLNACKEPGIETKTNNIKNSWDIDTNYHFGGYAKVNPELIDFKKTFEKNNKIPLDYIYTGKMMFGIYDLIKKGYFKRGETILAIHTGGLQGNKGMDKKIL